VSRSLAWSELSFADLPGRLRRLPEALPVLGRSFLLVARLSPAIAVAHLAIALLVAALSILQVLLAKVVLDALVAGDARRALLLAGAYALTLAIPPALNPAQWVIYNWFEDRGVGEIDRRLIAAGGRMPDLGRIERPEFLDEVELLKFSAYVSPRMMQVTGVALHGVVTLAGVLLLLGGLHPLLPVALVVAWAPQVIVEGRLADLTYEAMAERSQAAREMAYCVRVATTPEAAKEVRVFGLGPYFLRRFRERFAAGLREITRVRLASLRAAALCSGVHALAVAGGFWYVASRAGAGRLSLGDLALYLSAIVQAEGLLGLVPWWVGQPYMALRYTRALFRFLDAAGPSIALVPSGQARPAPAVLRSGVEFRGVRFRYPESTTDVLSGVSAVLPAGTVTALVGANGAGKSTLVKLLTRMYDPTGGQILLDGAPLRAYDLEGLRSRIAVVYQDFARFSLTLRENIAAGAGGPAAPGRTGEVDGMVERAARRAGADEVAARLPQGYDTELTRRFAGGVELSGGEWQKVALARAFVREAALVILDEPTAALDADAEFQVFERFRELVAGRTALLISHRLSTVRMADQILLLEGGRVAEAGSHAELLAQGGRYAALYEMQAGRYR
jgi:ATP-binding cassette subfamily B protein